MTEREKSYSDGILKKLNDFKGEITPYSKNDFLKISPMQAMDLLVELEIRNSQIQKREQNFGGIFAPYTKDEILKMEPIEAKQKLTQMDNRDNIILDIENNFEGIFSPYNKEDFLQMDLDKSENILNLIFNRNSLIKKIEEKIGEQIPNKEEILNKEPQEGINFLQDEYAKEILSIKIDEKLALLEEKLKLIA